MLLACVVSAAGIFAVLQWISERRAAEAALPAVEGSVEVPGLAEPVEVLRDHRGIPHVRAQSEADAWTGLGFVHAQDRLAHMLWLRRVAQGRTAELLGPAGLPADRLARTLGLVRLAQADLEALPGRDRALLRAYAAGVNARLTRVRSGEVAPPRVLPEPASGLASWTPVDSLALLKLHAWNLGGSIDESLLLAEMIRRFGGLGARLFFPEAMGLEAVPPRDDATRAATFLPDVHALRRAAGLDGRSVGSTAFAVGGAATLRGAPLLAADAHFEARAPAPYYEAHLEGGDVAVAGATIPGIPAFWSGFTPGVAWASVHAPVVVCDLLVESLHPVDPSRYHDGARWRSLEQREETIRVRGAPDETLVVRRTRRGPLVDGLFGQTVEPLAVRWTGALSGRGQAALFAWARARSGEDLRRALALHHEPVLQVVWVDASGGGRQLAGAVPDRALPTGGVPVPARNRAYVWTRPLAFGALPERRLGSGAGAVVAADGPLGGEAEARGIEVWWRSGHRASRVRALLDQGRAAGPLDLRDVVAIQDDVVSQGARTLVDTALELAGDRDALRREAREVVALLQAWDGVAAANSRGAAAYHVFLERLLRALFQPALGEPLLERYLGLRGVSPARLALRVLEAARQGEALPGGWAEPERVREAVRRSLRDTWISMSVRLGGNREKWTWGRMHPLRFEPLWPGAWDADSLGPYAYGGDDSSVRVAEPQGLGSFDVGVISAYRLALDARDLDQALTALAPGQSEHPGDSHSRDGLSRWLEGRPSLLSTSAAVIEDGEVARLTLEPPP